MAVRASRLVAVVVAAVATIATGGTSSAQSFTDDILVLPLESVHRGPAGTIVPLGSWPVPVELQGADCTVEVEATNQRSTHDGNDVLVTSAGTTVETFDVERVAFGVTTASSPITVGTTVDVSLRLGPDGVSSGGLLVRIDCRLITPTTTTEATTTTTTTSTTTSTTSTTEVPGGAGGDDATPGPGGVSAGDVTASPTLPTTGRDRALQTALAALVLLVGGGGLVAVARRSS